MSKLKRKGYVLFMYIEPRKVEGFDGGIRVYSEDCYCITKSDLMAVYNSDIWDKWDVIGRNHIHYFYLNIATGKYHPLPKYKKDYDPMLEYEQSEEKEPSTKIF